MQLLDRVQPARNGPQMLLVRSVHPLAPLTSLRVQILSTGKTTSCQETVFDELERPLHARRAAGVAAFVRRPFKNLAFAEGCRLRHRNHVATGAAGLYHNQTYFVRLASDESLWQMAARAAASLAIGTRYGLQET
jgi:hypothetical protein